MAYDKCKCIQSPTNCKKLEHHANIPRYPAHQVPLPKKNPAGEMYAGAGRFEN